MTKGPSPSIASSCSSWSTYQVRGSGDSELVGQPVGLTLVRGQPHGAPLRGGDPKHLRERRAVPRDRGHRLIARRIEDPAVQTESPARLQQDGGGLLAVAERLHPHAAARVAREPGDRVLVVQHAHRDRPATETSNDSQALVVPTEDHGSDLRVWNLRAAPSWPPSSRTTPSGRHEPMLARCSRQCTSMRAQRSAGAAERLQRSTTPVGRAGCRSGSRCCRRECRCGRARSAEGRPSRRGRSPRARPRRPE